MATPHPTPHQSRRWKVGTRESKSGKNRKGLISSVGQRWVAWGGSGNEILPAPFYQPFKAHYSGEGKTYKASALEHISVCLPETEKGCSGHASVIDSQFRLPLPFCLFCFSSIPLSPTSTEPHSLCPFLLCLSSFAVTQPWNLAGLERNIGKTVYLSWPLQIVSGRIASSSGDNCHLHNLMAIFDIYFSLAAGRNAAQALCEKDAAQDCKVKNRE